MVEAMRRLSVTLILALCTFSAYATSYAIVPGYGNRMCSNIRAALSDGLVLDAKRPLCGRRFELSPEAKRFGLMGIEKTLLPSFDYAGLMGRMLQVIGRESMPQSNSDKAKDGKIIADSMKSMIVKIYSSHFDADNSGVVHKVYVLDEEACDIKDSWWDGSVGTFTERDDGTLDPNWGVYGATAGVPFIYKSHTYYLKWQSLKGSSDKRLLTQLDVYDSNPFSPKERDIAPYQVLTPAICEIYQVNK